MATFEVIRAANIGGGGGTPGGTDGQVQYNNAGSFGGISEGTSGQVLTSTGVGSAPTFQDAAGGSSLFPLTGTGTATGDVVGDLGGNSLSIVNGNVGIGSAPLSYELFKVSDGVNNLLFIDKTNYEAYIGATDGIGNGFLRIFSNGAGPEYDFLLIAGNGSNDVSVAGDAIANTIVATAGGGIALSAPASTTASILSNGQISFYLDEVGNNLKVAVQYSDGTTKTGTVALA